MSNPSGRSRDSIADIRETLEDIITGNEHSETNEEGDSSVPVRFIPDIFRKLDDLGYSIISPDEEDNLKLTLAHIETADPSLRVTSKILIGLIEQLPRPEPDDSQMRGRPRALSGSSDSSSGSNGTSRNSSRPSSRSGHDLPPTPTNPRTPLDKRQRSTPLSANPPSAYSRRPPPARRKSDASPGRGYSSGGAAGDSDGGARRPRSRAGSQSVSTPSSSSTVFPSGPFSPSSPTRDRFLAEGVSSPEENTNRVQRQDYDFVDSVSQIPMPHSSDSDSSDDEDGRGSPTSMYTHLVFDPEHGARSTTSSTASLLPEQRLDALSRANTELAKRLQDGERTLQRKLLEHESDLEDLQSKMEELNVELAKSKRDEKELRNKDRTKMTQITSLESEITRINKQLINTKEQYNSLQKQYNEQTSLSEKYRVDLRDREETIRSLREQAGLYDIEIAKMSEREREWEDRVGRLERDVEEAREGCAQLEQQKIENLGLKETIDRMRFEMDDMRSAMTSGLGTMNPGMPGSGLNSRTNTMSKSLGAELQSQLEREERRRAEAEAQSDVEAEDYTDGEDTVVEEMQEDDEGNYVTTIIKRTRRKVPSKAQMEVPTLNRQYSGGKYTERRFEEFEDEKEYADCATQYSPLAYFDPDSEDGFLRSATIQTEEEPAPVPPVERVMAEMDIQTDIVEEEEEEELKAESSSSAQAPTDEPPAYPGPSSPHSSLADKAREAQAQAEKEEQAELAVLRKWHRSLDVMDMKDILMHSPRGSLSVSKEIMKDWARVQRAAGVDCSVVDRLLQNAAAGVIDGEEDEEEEEEEDKTIVEGSETRLSSLRRLSTHLPNLPTNIKLSSYIPQTLIVTSLSVLFGVMLAPHMGNQMNEPIGGANYYDRRAWSTFNTLGGGGEGFPGFAIGGNQGADGALWKVLEAVVGGGARIARGLPT